MNTFINHVVGWTTSIAFAIIIFALAVLAWQLYFAALTGLKSLSAYFKRKEVINKDACEKFSEMLKHFAESAEEVAADAKVNILNRDDSVKYATLGDIPDKEKIHHRIVRVGGDHPVDYIYSANLDEWNPLFGDTVLGYGAPTIMLKDIKDLNFKTRIPGQRICVPEVYKMYEIGADGEAKLLSAEEVIPSTTKEETDDGQSN